MKHVILFGLLSMSIAIMPADKGKQIIIDSSNISGTYQNEFNVQNAQSPLLPVNLSDQPKINNFHKVPQVPVIQPFQLGGKIFNQVNLKNASTKDQDKLLAMAYPSVIERLYGKDNETITPEELEKIDTMHEEIRAGLQFTMLSTQDSCIMSNNTSDCKGCYGGLCFMFYGYDGWCNMGNVF